MGSKDTQVCSIWCPVLPRSAPSLSSSSLSDSKSTLASISSHGLHDLLEMENTGCGQHFTGQVKVGLVGDRTQASKAGCLTVMEVLVQQARLEMYSEFITSHRLPIGT